MKLQRILWPTDGSKEANSSLRYAVFFAEKFKAEIIALYVSEIHFPIISLYPVPEQYMIDIAEKNQKKFEKRFKTISAKLKQQDIPFSHKIVQKNIPDGIITTAKNSKCDLIVMGKHGLGFIERTILGSNTAKVIKKSQIPVLSTSGKGRKKITQISKALVPIDVSDIKIKSVSSAIEYANELNASATLLYVFWLNEKVYDIPPKLLKKLVIQANQKLKKIAYTTTQNFKKSAKKLNTKINYEIIYGINPGHSVSWYAKKMKFDMIIMNTHGRTGVNRLLLGSEAEKIIRTAPCPVLIDRP